MPAFTQRYRRHVVGDFLFSPPPPPTGGTISRCVLPPFFPSETWQTAFAASDIFRQADVGVVPFFFSFPRVRAGNAFFPLWARRRKQRSPERDISPPPLFPFFFFLFHAIGAYGVPAPLLRFFSLGQKTFAGRALFFSLASVLLLPELPGADCVEKVPPPMNIVVFIFPLLGAGCQGTSLCLFFRLIQPWLSQTSRRQGPPLPFPFLLGRWS